MRPLITLGLVIAMTLAPAAFAQSSREYALMARSTWAAFECSILASHLKDQREAQRLFNYGYRQGKTFVDAAIGRKIEQKDLSSEAPWIVLALLQGPTPDFMLGRIFENAMDHTLKDILKSGDQMNPDDLQRTLAQTKYTAKNCRVIGPAR